jgi:hypothetical protein
MLGRGDRSTTNGAATNHHLVSDDEVEAPRQAIRREVDPEKVARDTELAELQDEVDVEIRRDDEDWG